MTLPLLPVRCPKCSEAQNTTPGNFDPSNEPFGPVNCMACGYEFMQAEYLKELETSRRELGPE
jgi:predicted Zn-ribbon and HTH transcriptional regulator